MKENTSFIRIEKHIFTYLPSPLLVVNVVPPLSHINMSNCKSGLFGLTYM